MDEDDSHFPVEVEIFGDSGSIVKVFESPHDLPAGVHLKVLRTKVKPEPKIINTGVPAVWGSSPE